MNSDSLHVCDKELGKWSHDSLAASFNDSCAKCRLRSSARKCSSRCLEFQAVLLRTNLWLNFFMAWNMTRKYDIQVFIDGSNAITLLIETKHLCVYRPRSNQRENVVKGGETVQQRINWLDYQYTYSKMMKIWCENWILSSCNWVFFGVHRGWRHQKKFIAF